MKVRESKQMRSGFGGHKRIETRVRLLAEGEAVPDGAEVVPDETPVSEFSHLAGPFKGEVSFPF